MYGSCRLSERPTALSFLSLFPLSEAAAPDSLSPGQRELRPRASAAWCACLLLLEQRVCCSLLSIEAFYGGGGSERPVRA